VADTMTAVIAIENGLELVTGNASDFQRVQRLATRSHWSTGEFGFGD
jgi:predicted nucleic acid-binding protein